MLTYIMFPPSKAYFNETYKMAFRKRKAKILAFNEVDEDEDEEDYEAGSITYSIFDFSYVACEMEDAIAESCVEDWGEEKFFLWAIENQTYLDEAFIGIDKVILFQELDLNIAMINEENVKLIVNTVNNEHNIYQSIAVLDTIYANPEAGVKAIFQKLGWKKFVGQYYFKTG